MNKKPNIIFVFCDDLGWGDVSCLNPESKIDTPHIDKLADRGMKFTDAHAGSAVCTPSRYTLVTGRYCWRTAQRKAGVNGGLSPALIKSDRMTVASMLKEQGYKSACIGKWHIGLDWATTKEDSIAQNLGEAGFRGKENLIDFSKSFRNGPIDVGFDYYYGIAASLDMIPYTFLEGDRALELPTDISPGGKTDETRAREGICAPGWSHEAVLPALQRKSIDFIKEQAEEKNPFFLYLPVNGPHTPVVPNKEWIGKSGCGIYGDFVMEIDYMVGEIVQTVKDAGIYENTIICFSSDNGPEDLTEKYKEQFGHSSTWRYRGRKRDNWEGGHRVPFIVSWPGTIEEGAVCERFVELADFTATVANITGAEIPDNAAEDSYNMFPLWLGEDAPDYRKFAIHHSCDGKWAIRKGRWKVLLHHGSGGRGVRKESEAPVQLYNMDIDPFETNNVYCDHPEIIKEIKQLCIDSIQNGRTTPGPKQPVEVNGEWKQFAELLELNI